MGANILPDSRLRSGAGIKRMVIDGVACNMVPLYCANCGTGPGPYVTEGCRAFWLCEGPDGCQNKPLAIKLFATHCLPDEVHNQLLLEEQLLSKGRPWTHDELIMALDDPNSTMTKLANDFAFTRGK